MFPLASSTMPPARASPSIFTPSPISPPTIRIVPPAGNVISLPLTKPARMRANPLGIKDVAIVNQSPLLLEWKARISVQKQGGYMRKFSGVYIHLNVFEILLLYHNTILKNFYLTFWIFQFSISRQFQWLHRLFC